jgi:hypothetical protein
MNPGADLVKESLTKCIASEFIVPLLPHLFHNDVAFIAVALCSMATTNQKAATQFKGIPCFLYRKYSDQRYIFSTYPTVNL